MRTFALVVALAVVLLGSQAGGTLAAPASESATLTAEQQAAYTRAVGAFRDQRYAAAYGRFVRLADAGHSPSAQLALAMYRNGHALFDYDWDATPEQLDRWTALLVEGTQGGHGPALAD